MNAGIFERRPQTKEISGFAGDAEITHELFAIAEFFDRA